MTILHCFPLKCSFEIFHFKQNSGYSNSIFLYFSVFESEPSVVHTNCVEKQLNSSHVWLSIELKTNKQPNKHKNNQPKPTSTYHTVVSTFWEVLVIFHLLDSWKNLRDFLELAVYKQITLNWCITVNLLLLLEIWNINVFSQFQLENTKNYF